MFSGAYATSSIKLLPILRPLSAKFNPVSIALTASPIRGISPKTGFTALVTLLPTSTTLGSALPTLVATFFIVLPTYKTLHSTFQNEISEYRKYIENVDFCSEILKLKETQLKEEFMLSVLSIDAFTTTILKKELKENDNHCFIFNIQPFVTFYKNFIVHLEPSNKGNASQKIDEITSKIVKNPSKFKIFFISVDGDLHYDQFFQKQFGRLLKLYKEGGLSNVLDNLLDDGLLFSSDFLDINKNMRNKIQSNKIIINPFIPQKTINIFSVNEIIQAGEALFDRSSIGKMRDSYPIILFTIKNSLNLLHNYTNECFFYFIIFSFWSEAQLNEHITPNTRVYLINTLIHIFFQLFNEFSKTLPENVSMKNKPFCSQIFLTINKIQRIIPTLLAESYSIERFCEGLGIDRLSSHPCENRIGNIRTECNGNHSTENVFNSKTRYEYLKYALKDLNIKEDRPTHLNLGGCKTSVGEINFDFTIDDKKFAKFWADLSFLTSCYDYFF